VTTTCNIASQESLGGLTLSYMIDYSFMYRLCGFIAWRCMTDVYLGVYSMHKSSGSRVMFVDVKFSYIRMIHEIEYF